MTKRRALFLDRDGTLVHPFHYASRPEHLRLYDNIGADLFALQRNDFCLVLITNQSGLARGYFSEADLHGMHEYLQRELATWQVHLDAVYYCPHHVDGSVPELAVRCSCRKPQPGMLLRAAQELDLDLQRSWVVGDILDDVEAGTRAGCRTVLVDLGSEPRPTSIYRQPTFVASETRHALRIIRAVERLSPVVDLLYRPDAWQMDSVEEGNVCDK